MKEVGGLGPIHKWEFVAPDSDKQWSGELPRQLRGTFGELRETKGQFDGHLLEIVNVKDEPETWQCPTMLANGVRGRFAAGDPFLICYYGKGPNRNSQATHLFRVFALESITEKVKREDIAEPPSLV